MKKINLIIFTLLILIIALGTAIYLKSRPATEENIVSIPPPPAEPIKKPIVHYPVPEVKPATTKQNQVEQPQAAKTETKPPLPEVLPKVEESDQSIDQALASLFSGQELYKLFFMENFIQRIVATVDNLPEKQLPRAHLPIKPPAGTFFVSGTVEAPQTSSRNQKRYAPYVSLLESINQDKAVKIYVHFILCFKKLMNSWAIKMRTSTTGSFTSLTIFLQSRIRLSRSC